MSEPGYTSTSSYLITGPFRQMTSMTQIDIDPSLETASYLLAVLVAMVEGEV
jgi:hypothetical protein